MNDAELLKLAAMAAGIDVWFPRMNGGRDESGGRIILEPCHKRDADGNVVEWNPLLDDGDAFRLAVNLGIDLLFTPEDVEAVATQYAYEDHQEMLSPWACESWTLKPQDHYAATRRAIVRAAAEIGKQMGGSNDNRK